MKRHDIIFRASKVSNQMIRINLHRFFNRVDLRNSTFVRLNISIVKENQMTVLIREELVNRTDKNERKIFVRSLLDALNLRNISICGGDQLTIFYAESDNKTYLKYKNSLSRRLFSTLSRTNLGKRFYSTATKASDFVFKFINLVFPILETDINLTKLTNNLTLFIYSN